MFSIVFLSVQLFAFMISVDGANILACLTSASQSHHILETAILDELANRGHNVTYTIHITHSKRREKK